MASAEKEKSSKEGYALRSGLAGVVKVAVVAAASAAAGGLAVALLYRDTLRKLRNPVLSVDILKTGSAEFVLPDEVRDSDPESLPRLVQD